MSVRAAVALALSLSSGCGGGSAGAEPDAGIDAAPTVASLLPANYAAGFVEVRDCRNSIDHDLRHILIKADSAIAPRYLEGPFPFSVGTVIVKEEFSDSRCTTRVGYTLMRKEAAGYEPATGDWHWQRLDAGGRVLVDGKGLGGTVARCASCHAAAACRARDYTCAEP